MIKGEVMKKKRKKLNYKTYVSTTLRQLAKETKVGGEERAAEEASKKVRLPASPVPSTEGLHSVCGSTSRQTDSTAPHNTQSVTSSPPTQVQEGHDQTVGLIL